MQRFLSRSRLASSNFTKWVSSSSSNTSLSHYHHKPFTSFAKPLQSQFQTQLLSPFGLSLSCRSHHHTLSGRFQGFLLNPVIAKQFLSNLSNTQLRLSQNSLRFFRTQFPKQRFQFEPGFGFQRRGWRSWFRGLSPNDMVLGLIIANVAVFMLWRVADQRFMMENFTISLDNFKNGRVQTLITSAFSHIDIEHIISNMIGLYFFGTNIARVFGPEYLLKLYLAGAIGGSVFYLMHHTWMAASSKGRGMFSHDPSRTPGLGASGAVNAIMLLDIFLHPTATLYLNFIIPVPAILLGIFLVGKDMLRMIEGNSHISGSAHLGGAAVAAVAWAQIRKGRFRF